MLPRIPAHIARPFVQSWLDQHEGDWDEGAIAVLAMRADVKYDTLLSFLHDGKHSIDFYTLDKLFCAMWEPLLWYEWPLLPFYLTANLCATPPGYGRCKRPGCTKEFLLYPKHREGECACGCGSPAPIPKKTNTAHGLVAGEPARFARGHNIKPRKWCSDTCKRAEWAHRTGRSQDMRLRCKNGHDRTDENTYVTPAGVRQCRDCRRELRRPPDYKQKHAERERARRARLREHQEAA